MLYFLKLIFSFSAINLIAFITFVFVGSVFLKFSGFVFPSRNKFFQLAFSAFIGLVLFVILFSLIKTSFVTVNYIAIVVLFWLLYYNKKEILVNDENFFSFNFSPAFIFEVAGILFLFTIYELFFLFDFKAHDFIPPHSDFTFSANVSYFLNANGNENTFMEANDINSNYNGCVPYHYFEIWITAFLSSIFSINPLKIIMLCTFPLFFSINYFLVLSFFIKESIINGFFFRIVVFLSLFTGSFYFQFLNTGILSETDTFSGTVFLSEVGKKYAYWSTVYLLSFYFIKENKNATAMAVLCLLPVFSITALLPMLCLFVLLFLFSFLKVRNQFFFAELRKPLVVMLIILILILAFYQIAPVPLIGLGFTDNAELVDTLFSLENIQTKINIIVKTLIQTLLIYSPFLLLIIYKWRTILNEFFYRNILFVTIILVLSGLMVWTAFSNLVNSTGFFSGQLSVLNSFIPLILISLMCKLSLHESRFFLIIVMILFTIKFGSVLYGNYNLKLRNSTLYSFNYIDSIRDTIDQYDENQKLNIAYISNDYSTVYSVNSFFAKINKYLFYAKPKVNQLDVGLITIDSTFIKQQSKSYKQLLTQSLFFQYLKSNRLEASYKTMYSFLLDNNVNFFICNMGNENILNDSLNKFLVPLYNDSISGEYFYSIKK